MPRAAGGAEVHDALPARLRVRVDEVGAEPQRCRRVHGIGGAVHLLRRLADSKGPGAPLAVERLADVDGRVPPAVSLGNAPDHVQPHDGREPGGRLSVLPVPKLGSRWDLSGVVVTKGGWRIPLCPHNWGLWSLLLEKIRPARVSSIPQKALVVLDKTVLGSRVYFLGRN
jgi:hypothetical protein